MVRDTQSTEARSGILYYRRLREKIRLGLIPRIDVKNGSNLATSSLLPLSRPLPHVPQSPLLYSINERDIATIATGKHQTHTTPSGSPLCTLSHDSTRISYHSAVEAFFITRATSSLASFLSPIAKDTYKECKNHYVQIHHRYNQAFHTVEQER